MAKKPVYVGVFLNESSKEELFRWWEAVVEQPLLSKRFGHHMTVVFKPSSEDLELFDLGTPVNLRVIGWAASDRVQTVVVEGCRSANSTPHITVATDGTPPKESNGLLAAGYVVCAGPVLTGTLDGFYPGGK